MKKCYKYKNCEAELASQNKKPQCRGCMGFSTKKPYVPVGFENRNK